MAGFAESNVKLGGLGMAAGKVMSTPASDACYAMIDGVTTTVRILDNVSVSVGDTALLAKHKQSWFIVGVIKPAPSSPLTAPSNPPDNPPQNRPPPQPNPPIRSGSLIVAPVQTATYRDGKWRTDLDGGTSAGDTLQGVFGSYGNNTGCAFYGTKPRTLDGATVTSASIRVRRLRAGAYAARQVTLRLVTQATRPAGAPTLTSSTGGPSLAVDKTNNAFSIPTSWAQDIVDGVAGGLAIFESDGDPYVRLAGRASWSPAWTLTINWRK